MTKDELMQELLDQAEDLISKYHYFDDVMDDISDNYACDDCREHLDDIYELQGQVHTSNYQLNNLIIALRRKINNRREGEHYE